MFSVINSFRFSSYSAKVFKSDVLSLSVVSSSDLVLSSDIFILLFLFLTVECNILVLSFSSSFVFFSEDLSFLFDNESIKSFKHFSEYSPYDSFNQIQKEEELSFKLFINVSNKDFVDSYDSALLDKEAFLLSIDSLISSKYKFTSLDVFSI